MKNSMNSNYKNTLKVFTSCCVTACNFAIIFECIYAKMPYDDHLNFLSPELDGKLSLNFAR